MKAVAFTLSLSLLVIYVGSSLEHRSPGHGDGPRGRDGSYYQDGVSYSSLRGGGILWHLPAQVYSSSRSDEHEEDQKAQLHPVGRSSSWDEHEEDQKDRSEQCPTPVGIGICVDLCGDDWSCPGEENCCSNGCGHVCTKPTPSCLDVNCLKGTICIVIDGKAQCAPLAQTDGSSSSDEHEEDQKGPRSSSGSFEESEEYGRDRDTDQRTARPSSPCTRAGAEHVLTRVAEGVAKECSRILDWDDDLGSSLGADLLAAFDNFIDREGLTLKESPDDD